MILSRAGEYGVQIALYLAAERPRGYVPVRELSRRCGIPFFFLGKICHRLSRGGILLSYKGPNGGVALARRPEEITLLEVIQALDGLEGFSRCVLGLEFCDSGAPCPVHDTWSRVKDRILEMLSGKNLGQLAEELGAGKTTLRQVWAADAVTDTPAGRQGGGL
jgi:Rrf2 family protein